jgi:pimeloyl-ACP methyl ester carboxylesterase
LNIHHPIAEATSQGWSYWPEREDLSAELARLLVSAQDGGASLAECLAVAGRIDFSNDTSWHSAWKGIADANRERGDGAWRKGHVVTARSNWLRAINYYLAAAFPFERSEPLHNSAIADARRCAADFIHRGNPAGEVVGIDWPGGYPLEGYFLPADAGSAPKPTVICIGEPGRHKEEYLFKAARHARERGMSLLAVDLLGAGSADQFEEIVGRRDLERVVASIMDYLIDRKDVDEARIAIVADAWGSSFVARGIAFDDRFAAAVCDGGIWDLHERAFLRSRMDAVDGNVLHLGLSRIARNIRCPVLIAAGARGWLSPTRLRELHQGLRTDHREVTLKIFSEEETASAQGHTDNPTLANEYIFDWVAAHLSGGITDNPDPAAPV